MVDIMKWEHGGGIMALNIRNSETERLLQTLVDLTGESKTEAVTKAVRARINQIRRERARRRLADELDEVAVHCARLPILDPRSADEIIGYNHHGTLGS
jgi:antitoxin VapB